MTPPLKNLKWISYPLGDITQYFRENPKLYAQFNLNGHNGIDIVRPWGEHLFACEAGVICDADFVDEAGGYGLHVRILVEYEKGKYREWTYGHMSYIHVKVGDRVEEGQYLGNIGNTGFVVSGSTEYWKNNPYAGTHVHFGLREMERSSTGWKYPVWPQSPKVECRNYSNGFKGAIDPIPFFFPSPKARMVRAIAEARKSATLYKVAELFRSINI